MVGPGGKGLFTQQWAGSRVLTEAGGHPWAQEAVSTTRTPHLPPNFELSLEPRDAEVSVLSVRGG